MLAATATKLWIMAAVMGTYTHTEGFDTSDACVRALQEIVLLAKDDFLTGYCKSKLLIDDIIDVTEAMRELQQRTQPDSTRHRETRWDR